jgi:Fur family transcriptional regulator, ferric uptake regulator
VPEPESYSAVLHARGLSVTRLRLAIMRVLHGEEGAASAAELLRLIQREDRSVHKTTIYRNLSALEQAGLLRKLPSGRTFLYELTCDHSPPAHPHFTCRRCNRFICLEPVDLSSVWGLLTHSYGLVAETAEITLVGLCKECAAAGDAPAEGHAARQG